MALTVPCDMLASMSSLLSGLEVAFRFSLLGAAWTWILPGSLLQGRRPWHRMLFTGAAATMISVPAVAIIVLILGEAGKYDAVTEYACLASLAVLGIGIGLARCARVVRRRVLATMPAAALLAAGTLVLLAVPDRGEWLLGSWDPGVYVNEAVVVERTGTFHPPDSFFHDSLAPHEQLHFTRLGLRRHERFPGVVVDAESQAFSFTFFRLTPAVFASMLRAGGMPLLHRANAVLGLLVLLSFSAFVVRVLSPAGAAFSLLMLVTQPVWIYHTHVPVSEMLQVYLLCSLFFLLPHIKQHRSVFFLGLLMLASMTVNRFSFMPFAGLLAVSLALVEFREQEGSRKVGVHLGFCLAVIAGAIVDLGLSPTSFLSWGIGPLIIIATGFLFTAALLIDLVSLRKVMGRFRPWILRAAGVTTVVLLAVLFTRKRLVPMRKDSDNPARLLPFLGLVPVLFSVGGAARVALHWRRENRALKGILIFLLVATAGLLFRKNIADLYPWATRRYFPFTVPLVALLGGYFLAWLWQWGSAPRTGRVLACLAFALSTFVHGTTIRAAWEHTDFNGVSDLLEQISAQVDAGDVIVADHPRWGTPLALLYGKQVLNGQPLWRDNSGRKAAAAFRALERIAADGTRVHLLTSSDRGTDIYPVRVKTEEKVWSSGPVTLGEIVHHPKASRFVLDRRERTFRLYTLAARRSE